MTGAAPATRLEMYRAMVRARRFEQSISYLCGGAVSPLTEGPVIEET